MQSVLLRILSVLFISIFSLLLFILSLANAKAESANHVVLSEVKIGGATTTDEFVELYNPSQSDISLNGWQLKRKTQAGTESVLVGTISGTIRSHGFFLITHVDYTGSTSADQVYSENNSLSANNTVLLYDNQGLLIDKVGFGTATDKEGSAETDPSTGTSRERKANAVSTPATMSIGGVDELAGNAEDTDNNAADFILRNIPQPQNSNSTAEPAPVDTPTPTSEPTITPTEIPTPSASPSPSLSITPNPTSQPTITPVPFPRYQVLCTTRVHKTKMLMLEFSTPIPSCQVVRY